MHTPARILLLALCRLVIGGGDFGAAAARDAALRGLSTTLVERADFGGGVSANCFKMVHGGIRYLQNADIPRLRYSCAEPSAWLRIAPPGVTRQRDAEPAVIPGTTTLYAEVTHVVLRESALRLEDVVLRRTDLGAGLPGRQILAAVAFHMGALLGWTHKREQIEVDACHQALARLDAREPFPEIPTLRMVGP